MKNHHQPFTKEEVMAKLAKLDIVQNKRTGTITTNYDGAALSSYTPTEHYQVIDFKKVGADFMKKVSEHMVIKNYQFKISRGIQELRLFGENFKLAGDVYKSQAVLISSTDGTRTLSIMVGLWRQICSNGAMRKISGESFRVRHLKKNQEVMKTINCDFGDLQKAFKSLKSQVEKLQTKTITLGTIRENLVKKDGKGSKKFIDFVHKLYTSKTDKLEYNTIPAEYRKVIRQLADEAGKTRIEVMPEILKMKNLNLKLNAYQAFQCYTETVRAWDASVIEADTERFLEMAK